MVASQVFASMGIGSLIGLLVGLSASPVVGIVVGALAALVAPVIEMRLAEVGGSSDNKEVSIARQKLVGLRAGFFCITCIVGVLSGVLMRTHQVLSPSAPTWREQLEELKSIGVDTATAQSLVVARILSQPPIPNHLGGGKDDVLSSVLFGGTEDRCQQLSVDQFLTVSAAANYYRNSQEPSLAHIAEAVDQFTVPEADKKKVMRAVLEAVCRTR